ncbi:MAG: cation transporter [Pseudomonadota bacterium]|nr:cation transporter [Pseudomonadota bacterium]
MKKPLIILILATALSGSAVYAAEPTKDAAKSAATANVVQGVVTLDVPGMFCPTCPFTVRKSLEKLPGVSKVETSLNTKTAVVTYDPSKVKVEKLIETTTAIGYPSTVKNVAGE